MKKSVTTVVFPICALLLLAACGEVADKKKATAETVATPTVPAPATVAGVQLKDDQLNALYQQYAQLTAALVKGDAKEARFASNAIEAGAREMKSATQLGVSAAKITATADLEAQRTAFATLSNDLLALIKQSGLQTGQLYVDFCPMALNDQGAVWISSDKTIQNPYFGEHMLTCGAVKETIQ
ncbi:MAG: DUF3347 domain-containing protein [Chitinophaga sp.]|uniref:DUF3347 domain-containing protein n=1 Tax=Chitinophaga sp. TaxID=1869181 RepID=UPI001AFFCAB4|nr:DUF3347 domain-containing protein [Chitinophaga sp.]MBO9729584.1 DUF3347 domain-containing protein [Chitinophaga sp.]